jgi:hypothetical protein
MKRLRLGIILSLFLLPVLILRAEEQSWKKYTNARFGFVLMYPPSLLAGPEPTNGGGREFHLPNKEFSVASSAHFFVPESGDSFDKRWEQELETASAGITYKKKTDNWYVVSGVAKDGTEFYHKLYRKGSNWAAFEITYPHTQNKKFDPWVTRIAKEFVPFLAGDYDRLEP